MSNFSDAIFFIGQSIALLRLKIFTLITGLFISLSKKLYKQKKLIRWWRWEFFLWIFASLTRYVFIYFKVTGQALHHKVVDIVD